MAATDMYKVPPMPPNAINPGSASADICYLPSAPMQSAPPPPPPPLYSTPAAPIPSLYPTAVPPPPYIVSPTVQVPMNPSAPVFFTQMQVPYQGVIITNNVMPPQTVHIKDYMVWSIINVFLGGCILGFIAVLLSSQTRRRKQEGDVHGARSMSNITLVFNILVTLIFFASSAFLIVYFIVIYLSLEELQR